MGPTVQSSWVHLHCKLPCWVQRERMLQLLLSCICETIVHKNLVHKIACSLTCKYEKTFPCFKVRTDFLVEFLYTDVLKLGNTCYIPQSSVLTRPFSGWFCTIWLIAAPFGCGQFKGWALFGSLPKPSLVPTLRAPPGEKWSGERSRNS